MFVLNINKGWNKIHEITDILVIRMDIEPIKTEKLCQNANNVKLREIHCNIAPRAYVRCSVRYDIKKIYRNAQPKCVDCGYPGNFPQCIGMKEIEKSRSNQNNKVKLLPLHYCSKTLKSGSMPTNWQPIASKNIFLSKSQKVTNNTKYTCMVLGQEITKKKK